MRYFDHRRHLAGQGDDLELDGLEHTVSETGSSAKTHFKSYDPFGRPQTITPPGGSAHDVSLTYTGVREVRRVTRYNAADQLSATAERYDRQGRLYQVVEPAAPAGGNMTASYTYDVGGRLAAVFMTGGGLTQGREFTYDKRGLLLRERHPEKGPSGNGYVRYFGYDALGNPGRKVDAVGTLQLEDLANAEIDLTFTYDRASRLTHQDAKGVIFKTFEYGAANLTGDWRLGRLWRATRHNYVWLGPTPYNIPVEETYVHGGPAGAVTARTTQAYNGPPSSTRRRDMVLWSRLARRAEPLVRVRQVCGPRLAYTVLTIPSASSGVFRTSS